MRNSHAPERSRRSGAGSLVDGRPRPLDPFTLLVGVFSVVIGVGILWTAFVGPLNPALFNVAAPLGLVVFGALGLALSRAK